MTNKIMPTTTKLMVETSAAPASTDTYAASYAKLAAIAERLRAGGGATSVDTLVEDVRAARAAHDVCRARLAAVRREIDAEVAAAEGDEAGTDAAGQPGA